MPAAAETRYLVLCFSLAAACTGAPPEPAPLEQAVLVNCSTKLCSSLDQQNIGGYRLFNEDNFAAITDAFGRRRKFFVHIPYTYDAVDSNRQKVPLIFAFHGGGQAREAMIAGKWGDYFDQDYAFVIPLGEPDPCDNPNGAGKAQWLTPGLGQRTSPTNPNCDPATEVITPTGTMSYWNASLPGSFVDVRFIVQLREMLLSRFSRLNPNKVYATGFSSGGGMTFALLCYRSGLFRGFSVVAKTLAGDNARGDYDMDGVVDLDPLSLTATCGRPPTDPAHATGIPDPQQWGWGATKPVALFVGDQDNPMQEIDETSAFICARNNLNGTYVLLDPFLDTKPDQATTQRRSFHNADNPALPRSAFRRFLVQGVPGVSAGHAMPDAQQCNLPVPFFMTCDYSYTAQTKTFFEEHADLSLAP